MKTNKLSFDLGDVPELVELLRMEAVKTKTSQKGILIKALECYFANKLETTFLLKSAEKMFIDWDNKEDSIYDDL